jgi:hypothetical protein
MHRNTPNCDRMLSGGLLYNQSLLLAGLSAASASQSLFLGLYTRTCVHLGSVYSIYTVSIFSTQAGRQAGWLLTRCSYHAYHGALFKFCSLLVNKS